MKRLLLSLALLCAAALPAQVTIGSKDKPAVGALLDLKQEGTTTKGLGLPRVELQAYDQLKMGATAIEHADKTGHAGLVVYNIADATKKCDPNHPTTGLHVWDGGKWVGINAAPPYAPGGEAPGPDAVYAPNTYINVGGGTITIPVEKAFAIWDWWGGGQHPRWCAIRWNFCCFHS